MKSRVQQSATEGRRRVGWVVFKTGRRCIKAAGRILTRDVPLAHVATTASLALALIEYRDALPA
jgi:hypothetical protein